MAVGIDVHGNPGCGRRPGLAGAALVRAAGDGRRGTTPGRIAPRAGARSGRKLGIQGCVASARWRVSQRAASATRAGRARAATPRPRPAREVAHRRAGGGQHQVGIEALQRVDPVGRRHLSSASASVPTSGDWPCASGATNWPSHGDRRPRRLRQAQGRQRRVAAGRQPFAGGFDVLLAQPLQRGVGIGRRQGRRRQRDTRVGSSRSGASATSKNTVGRRLFQHLEQRVGRDHVQRMGRIQ